MSYGVARQLLVGGLESPERLLEASSKWPDDVKRLHTEVGIRAFEFIEANGAYAKAQQDAMDLATVASQRRIYLHNAVSAWMDALGKATADDAGDPVSRVTTS